MDAGRQGPRSWLRVTSVVIGLAFVAALSSAPAAPAQTASYVDTVRGDQPLFYWRLNEPVGVSTAADMSGRGNTGTYTTTSRRVPGALTTDPDTAMALGQYNAEPQYSGDAFAKPRLLSGLTGAATGFNVDLTREAGEPNHAGQIGGRSQWYSWTPSTSGTVSFDTAGSGVDTLLAVYTGTSLTSLTTVASNDNQSGTTTSKVTFSAVANTTYRIAVDGKADDWGRYYLKWIHGTLPQSNNPFAAATPIAGRLGDFRATNRYATKETGEPAHGGNSGGRSLWYRWTATVTGSAYFSTNQSNFKTLLGVYTGSSLTSLTKVASNSSGSLNDTSVSFPTTQGASYWVAVDGANATSGEFQLMWDEGGPPNVQGAQGFAGTTYAFAGVAPFTLEAWVSPDPGVGNDRHVIARSWYGDEGYWLAVDATGVALERVNTATTLKRDTVRTSTPLPNKVWTHVVGTFDSGTLSLYVNGARVASAPSNGMPLAANQYSPLYLGLRDTADCTCMSNWGGGIDEAAVYGRALTSFEVAEHYEAGRPQKPALTITGGNLVGSAPVGGIGTVTFDATDNVGIRRAWLTVDGSAKPAAEYPCNNAQLMPCGNVLGGRLQIDTRTLANGGHSFTLTVEDAVGVRTTSTARSFTVSNSIHHGRAYTGDPAAGGELVHEEWAILRSTLARREIADAVNTRGPVACAAADGGQWCDEVRWRTLDSQLEGAQPTDFDTFTAHRGAYVDDANLPPVGDMLLPAEYSAAGLTPAATGSLSSVLAAWQVPPPGNGGTYAMYNLPRNFVYNSGTVDPVTGEYPSGSVAGTSKLQVWVDQVTMLPIRFTSTHDDSTDAANLYWTYDAVTQPANHPADFFLVSEPADATMTQQVTYSDAKSSGSVQDNQSGKAFTPIDLGTSPTIGGRPMCLVTTRRFEHAERHEPAAAIRPSGPDFSRITRVDALYAPRVRGRSCSTTPGSAADSVLSVSSTAVGSALATGYADAVVPAARRRGRLSPGSSPFEELRGARIQPQPGYGYIGPRLSGGTFGLAQLDGTTVLVQGEFTDEEAEEILTKLEKRG